MWCWGDGHQGKLGNGGVTDTTTPVQVKQIADAAQLSVGANHACALTSAGAAFCWGSNRYGQIGNGDRTGVGVTVRTPSRVVDYSLGRATFIPRALVSFPTGTNGGQVELRTLVLRKTSARYPCPTRATVRTRRRVGRPCGAARSIGARGRRASSLGRSRCRRTPTVRAPPATR